MKLDTKKQENMKYRFGKIEGDAKLSAQEEGAKHRPKDQKNRGRCL